MFIAAEAEAGLANATLEHRLAAIRLVQLGPGTRRRTTRWPYSRYQFTA